MITDTAPTAWVNRRIKEDEILKYMDHGRDFIPDDDIEAKIREDEAREPDPAQIRDILAKSMAIKDLTTDEVAVLIRVKDKAMLEEMRQTAYDVKQKVYDNRIVTFAPFYLGNYCVNRCAYCGFNHDNEDCKRKVLTEEEIRREVEILAGKIGHKRLIVVYGEHPRNDVDYIVESLKTIYSVQTKTKNGTNSIRRVNV